MDENLGSRLLDKFRAEIDRFAIPVGIIVILFYTIKISYYTLRCLRLYFWSQQFGGCIKGLDLKKKYGKWAVITGAADGIGQAFAHELVGRGMSIVAIGRDEKNLAATKAALEAKAEVGVEIETIKIDLSDPSVDNFKSILSLINPEHRDIGILINNAGIYSIKFKSYLKHTIEYDCEMVNVNVMAPLHLTKMILPGMLGRGRGMIINVSSIANDCMTPYLGVYSPTKAFLSTFTRQLQTEYSSRPIDFVDLTPGLVHTRRLNKASLKITGLSPLARDFVKSVINALACRPKHLCGTFVHEMLHILIKPFNLLPLIMRDYYWIFDRRPARLNKDHHREDE